MDSNLNYDYSFRRKKPEKRFGGNRGGRMIANMGIDFKSKAGAKVPDAIVEACRQDYLSGMSLAEVARKHGLSVRSIKRYAATGKWTSARACHHLSPQLQGLAQAADRRADAVDRKWRERLESILDLLANVTEREAALLQQADTTQADWKDRASLIKLLVSSLADLRHLFPNAPEYRALFRESPESVTEYTDEELWAIIRQSNEKPDC